MPGFSCPYCGLEVANVPATLSGKRVRCKKCNEVFQLPAFEAAIEPVAAETIEPASPFDFNTAYASPRHAYSATAYRSSRRRQSNTCAVVAFVLGIVSILLFWVPVVGMLLCLVTLVTAVIGMIGARKGSGGMAFAVIGGILAALGIAIYIALLILFFRSTDILRDAVREAEIEQARDQIGEIETLLDAYHLENGEYPARLEELSDTADDSSSYVDLDEDPWRNAWQYTRVDDDFRLWSRGPDGKSGTADDVRAKRR